MATYILFGIGLGGIILLFLVKSIELRKQHRFFPGVRAYTDRISVITARIGIELPKYVHIYAQRLWGRTLHAVGAGVAHAIVILQKWFRQFQDTVHRRAIPLKRTRTVSSFLSHVAEHKKRIHRHRE